MLGANAAVELTLDRARRLVMSGKGNVLSILQEADRELAKRLERIAKGTGGLQGRYTEAHAQVYQQQIRLVMDYVQQKMLGLTDDQAREAIRFGVKATVDLAQRLEQHFTGITQPLALQSQQMQDEIVRGTGASRIRQVQSSWERYGDVVTKDFERVMRVGQLMGATQHEVISRLVEAGGRRGVTAQGLHEQTPGSFPEPTSLVSRRYWAERIVRTETSHSLNAANLATMNGMRNTDFPDMQKKILAHFDNRTAPDSVAVHGQVRPMDGYFMDGAGRQYLHPPGRPNDRETVVPWRPHWGSLEATDPPPPAEQAEAQAEASGATERHQRKVISAAAVAQRRERAKAAAVARVRAREIAKQEETLSYATFAQRSDFNLTRESYDQMQKFSRKYFGRELTPEHVRDLIGLDGLIPGARVTYHPRPYKDEMSIGATLRDANGKVIAGISRGYYFEGRKRIVHHEIFKIVDEYQGSKLGSQVLKRQVAQYLQYGISRIDTEAAWVGQYYWPSIGFRLKNAEDLLGLKKEFARYLIGAGIRTDAIDSIAERIGSVRDIAISAIGEKRVGKEFLLWRGKNGPLIHLQLDLGARSKDLRILKGRIGL